MRTAAAIQASSVAARQHAESLIGIRYGKLVVVGLAVEQPGHGLRMHVVCDCGNAKVVNKCNLTRKPPRDLKSCGCAIGESNRKNKTIHGKTDSATYKSWRAMHQRCSDVKNIGYERYGGRGITVCERWSLFSNFLADMGEREGDYTLDRIDVNGNYEPTNCRWATKSEQARNRRPPQKKAVTK